MEGLQDVLDRALADGETHRVLPPKDCILRAFEVPPSSVKVLIVGQDPYPTPGHAVGLAFSSDGAEIPRSLQNIYTEYCADTGHPRPRSADLSPWSEQGVLLLNRVLTVRAGQPNSHQSLGWEAITEAAVRQVAGNKHFAAILWGRPAQKLQPIIGAERCVCSPHPSPLSARRGFFGSRPFSRANEILRQQGAAPVDWNLGG
ncbi:uracil-DNA glycosylase [Corynebacterium heidelbergense]|uniref:uracil-DNA glycosylase n=2 Tax=Corynebacterium heidelbergense TaxID=2055947 RepID=UPI003B59E115